MADCFIPLTIYTTLALVVIFAAFKAARSWSWPLLGYAAIGFIVMLILCSAELTFLMWMLIATPIFLGIAALVWRQLCNWIDSVETTPTSISFTISSKECNTEDDDTCCCANQN